MTIISEFQITVMRLYQMPGIISMQSTRERAEQVYGSKILPYSLMGLHCNQGYPFNITERKAMST